MSQLSFSKQFIFYRPVFSHDSWEVIDLFRELHLQYRCFVAYLHSNIPSQIIVYFVVGRLRLLCRPALIAGNVFNYVHKYLWFVSSFLDSILWIR